MELPHGVDAISKGDEAQKSVQADESSSGEKSNIGLVINNAKAKPIVRVGVRPKYKLYRVNLEEICIKGLIDALNGEKGVAVVARYNCTNESVSINIPLPLTHKQQHNVRVKHVGHQDARICLIKVQVKFMKNTGWSGFSSSVISLLTIAPYTLEVGVKPNYKLYPVNLDETCTKGLIKAINSDQKVTVAVRYNHTKEANSKNIKLPLTRGQLQNIRAKHAR